MRNGSGKRLLAKEVAWSGWIHQAFAPNVRNESVKENDRIDLVQPQNKSRFYLPERLMPPRAQENALYRIRASVFVVEE